MRPNFVSFDEAKGLFVQSYSGFGRSCLSLKGVLRRLKGVSEWLGRPQPAELLECLQNGSHLLDQTMAKDAFELYQDIMEAGQEHFKKTREFCPLELSPIFQSYYQSKERVEVVWKEPYQIYSGYGCKTDGKKGRFYIGRSMGWLPIYLQLDNSRSISGPGLDADMVQSIRGLGVYRKG